MTATHVTAVSLGYGPPAGVPAPCGLCGAWAPARPWRSALKPTFTNLDELQSDSVCWACQACLDDRRTRSSFVVEDGRFRPLARGDVWPLLMRPPEPPFVLYLTHSGKKHGLFRQHVARSRERFRLQCEDRSGWFSPLEDLRWMRAAARLVVAGVRRESIATGDYQSHDYFHAGIPAIRDAERLLGSVRQRDLFGIVFGLMPARASVGELLDD